MKKVKFENLKLSKDITESGLRLFYDDAEKLYFLAKNTGQYSCLQLYYAERVDDVIKFKHNDPLKAGLHDVNYAYSPKYIELNISA